MKRDVAMLQIICIPPVFAARAPVLTATLVMLTLGCREEATSPAAPEPGPALDVTPAQAMSFRQVSAGAYQHTCGVTSDDRAYCWGNNAGALGDGTTINRLRPVAVAGGLRFRQVSVGYFHTCGVTTDSKAYCWGENVYGNLGDGTTTKRLTPVAVVGGHRFREVRAGETHACGVTPSDVAFCWGDNRWGQLGDSSALKRRQRPVRVAGGRDFRQVRAGGIHTCGVTIDDRAFCWGYGGDGQIGDGKTYQRRWPRAVAGGLRFRQVVAGQVLTCGVTRDDRAWCWGRNDRGQLGDGTTTGRLKPVAVAGGLQFSGVSPGHDHTCGVTTGGAAYCWGWNLYGQLGDGTHNQRATPVAVLGGLQFVFSGVDTGGDHTCGIGKGNAAYCWGLNAEGQLGDGTRNSRSTPGAVAGTM